MNRVVVAGVVSIAALLVVALAFAAGSSDHEDSAVAPTATPPVQSTPQPTQAPATLAPTQRPNPPIVDNTQAPSQPITSPTGTAIPLPRHPEAAPIDGLEVRTLESFPPQYVVHVLAGLPSGCAQPLSHQVTGRAGQRDPGQRIELAAR